MRFRNALEIWPSDNGARAGYLDVRGTNGATTIQLNGANGEATVKVLTITGGADIAEPFQISGTEIPKASNLAALRALATDGIQRGHMRLHRRSASLACVGDADPGGFHSRMPSSQTTSGRSSFMVQRSMRRASISTIQY